METSFHVSDTCFPWALKSHVRLHVYGSSHVLIIDHRSSIIFRRKQTLTGELGEIILSRLPSTVYFILVRFAKRRD